MQSSQSELTVVVSQELNPSPNGIKENIRIVVAVPIGDRKRGVAPFRFTRTLYRTTRSGFHAKRLAIRFKQLRRPPFRQAVFRFSQVFKTANVSSRVPAKNIFVTVIVPIVGKWRGECSELQGIGLLLKVSRLVKYRHAIDVSSCVLNERDATIFIADDQIHIAIAVPIDGCRRDHLQIHHQRLAVAVRQFASRGVLRRLPTTDILEPGKAVEKLAADQIQIAVTIKVRKVRRWPTVHINITATRFQSNGTIRVLRLFVRAMVFDQIDVAMERSVSPATMIVVCIVPSVIGPIADSSDQVMVTVSIKVDITPHSGSRRRSIKVIVVRNL